MEKMKLRQTEAWQRASAWTSLRLTMTSKERKEWQAAMEPMEKRMVEVVQATAEKHNMLVEMKELLVQEVRGLKKEIGDMKVEVQINTKKGYRCRTKR